MADIQYPSTLPNFKLGKKRAQAQTFRTSQPFGGPMFIEQFTDESPVVWDVTIQCVGSIQARQFQAFLRAVANGEPFDKEILTEEGAVDHEIRFIEMPLQPTQLSDYVWVYSGAVYAVKLIQPDSDIDNDDLIIDWLQGASIIDTALNELWPTP